MRTTEATTAIGIETTKDELVIRLADRELRLRWERCSPILAAATDEEAPSGRAIARGLYGIHWPLLDEDLSIGGLAKQS